MAKIVCIRGHHQAKTQPGGGCGAGFSRPDTTQTVLSHWLHRRNAVIFTEVSRQVRNTDCAREESCDLQENIVNLIQRVRFCEGANNKNSLRSFQALVDSNESSPFGKQDHIELVCFVVLT